MTATKSRTRTAIDTIAPDYESRNDRYRTPLELIETIGPFDLDPCGAPGHPTAREVWTPEDVGDGLSLPWHGRVWLKPPYGRTMADWVTRLADHGRGTALLFARTDTALFHEHVFPRAHGIRFIRRRVTFGRGSAPSLGDRSQGTAASVLIAYGADDFARLVDCTWPGRTFPLGGAL